MRELLLDEWLPAIKGTLRLTTHASYCSLCECHIIPRLGLVQLQKLVPSQINGLCAYLPAEGRVCGQGGLSPSSVRRVHAVLHRACRDAVRWGRLTVNPANVADPPKASAEYDELVVWSAGQLAAFLASVCSDRLFALWRLLAMTGMRRGEVLALRWDDLDMEAGQLSIRRALMPVNGVARICEPKTKRGRRTIALDLETLAALAAHAARQADERSQSGEAWLEAGYVFVRANGEALQPFAVSKAFRQHVRAACPWGVSVCGRLPKARRWKARGSQRRTSCRGGGRCQDHPSGPLCWPRAESAADSIDQGGAGLTSWPSVREARHQFVSGRRRNSAHVGHKRPPLASRVHSMVPFAAPLGQGCVHSEPLYRVLTPASSLLRTILAQALPASSKRSGLEEGLILAESDHKPARVSSASRRQGLTWQPKEGRRTGREQRPVVGRVGIEPTTP